MSYEQHIASNGASTHARTSGTKRKRANHESVDEEIAWTAARCQRLLRTIDSRINSLRKLLGADSNLEKSSSITYDSQKKKPQPKKAEHWSSVDPVWLPNGKPKSQGRTYAAKAKQAKPKVLNAREPNLVFPSPFIKRIGSNEFSKENHEPIVGETHPEKKSRRSRKLPVKPQSAAQEAETGLITAVSSLLSSTKAVKQVRNGSRSLLSTCLRKIPGYIELTTEESDDCNASEDIVAEVFTYLEDFGSREGWVGLREVVRRQCIHLVAKAISDNILSENTIHKLIDICSSQNFISEGQDLLLSWLQQTDVPSATSLEHLDAFASRNGCYGVKFRIFDELGRSQSSNMVRFGSSLTFWKDMLSSLTGDSAYEATQCLVNCVAHFADLETSGDLKAGIRSHMRELALKVTVMATASLLANEPSFGANGLWNGLVAVASEISLACGKSRRRRLRHLSEFETLFILGSQLLLGLDTIKTFTCGVFNLDIIASMLQPAHGSQRRISDLRMQQEDFAGEITKGIVTLEKFIGVKVTSKLLNQALDAIEMGSTSASLLKQVALETTTVLRQSDNASPNFDFEDYLKRLNQSGKPSTTVQTPHQGSKSGKFRWEDGLCEWVTATPFIGREVTEDQIIPSPDIDDNKEESSSQCSPDVLALSPPLKRRRTQVRSPLWNRKVTTGVVMIPTHKRPGTMSASKSVIENSDESGDELCL